MYAFGVDIPLIELLIAIGIINVIILAEIIVVLVLLLRRTKRHEERNLEMKKRESGSRLRF